MERKQASSLPATARRNIATIAEVEQTLLRRRSPAERMGQAVARFFGSLLFIAAHVFFFTFWIIINTGGFKGIKTFDPYPFAFLSLIVGIEFILLTTFVLLNQKHQIRREEQWSHLHLQLSMLTEQEVTKTVQMLSALCRQSGIRDGLSENELKEMAMPTSVTAFVGEIEKSRESGLGADEKILKMEKDAAERSEKKDDGDGR